MIFLVFLIGTAIAADLNCTQMDPTGQLVFSPLATACLDNVQSTYACEQLFNMGSSTIFRIEPGAPEFDRPFACYQRSFPSVVEDADIKRAAIAFCPRYCGYCCMTPAYKCPNVPAPRINCDAVSQSMCQSTVWRQLIAEDCPRACGFCEMNGCVDIAPDCSLQPTICSNPALATFVYTNCKRTCNLCPS